MGTELARAGDVDLTREEMLRSSFLVGYQQPTRDTYATNLDQWFRWCRENGLAVLDAKRSHIEAYGRWLEEIKNLMPSTVCNKLNTVCMFYKVAHRDGYLEDDPSRYVKKPSVPPGSRRHYLTKSELLKVLDAAQDLGPLEHAVIALLAFTGMRVGELCALNVEDLGRQDFQHTLKLRREKGNRDGVIPLAPRTAHALRFWIGTRTTGPLFLNRNEERVDRRAVDRIIKRAVKRAGIEGKNITPHSMRHTFVTIGMDANLSERTMVNSIGWSSSKMLYRIYDHGPSTLHGHAAHTVSAVVEGS